METANLPDKTVAQSASKVQALINRAQKGDESTLPMLRELLKAPLIMEACGNLAHHAENMLTRKFGSNDLALREGVGEKMDAMRAELAGPTPTPLERLLVERIAICWLHLYYLENLYASQDSMTLEIGMYYQRSIDRAHKRYLSAIKTLAIVRKLALPSLQINIAKKQVNVAGSFVATETENKTKGTSDD